MQISKRSEDVAPPGAADAVVDESTRHRILELLLSRGAQTTAQLAAALGLAAAGVRRHVTNLTESGEIEALEPDGPRGRGRPARAYRLTAAGRHGFGEAYDDLALSALAELVEMAGPDAVGRLAEKRLGDVEVDYRARRAADPTGDPLKHLADALSAAGYFASTQDEELRLHHCPIAHVASHYPQLCEAETHIFARLLGTDVSRSATIARGDVACRAHTGGPTLLPNPVSASTDRKVSV